MNIFVTNPARPPRSLWLALVLLLSWAGAAMAQADREKAVDLPTQPLQESLAAVGELFAITVIAPADLVRGVQSPAVAGRFTALAAVEQLLAGAPLVARRSASGAIVVAAPSAPEERPRNARTEADNGAIEIEPMVVTARRREESLQEVPLSMTVFSDEEILRSNFDSLSDYALRTPNLSFQNNGNRSRTILALRGVSDDNVGTTGTSVGMYLDEISLNPTGGLRQNDLALLDLERIEVLRGPQGTLFGRNTIGGAINLVSRKPSDEFSARITVGAEEFGTYYAQGHVNIGLSERVAVLASALERSSDGFVENSFLGTTLANSQTGGRIALRVAPTDALTIDLAAMRNVVRFDGLQGVLEDEFDANGFSVPFDFQPENRVTSDLYTARLEYQTPRFDVISLTAINEFERPESFDIDGPAPTQAFVDSFTTEDNFSQELRLQSNGPEDGALWTAGVYYGTTDDSNDVGIFFGGPENRIPLQTSLFQSEVDNRAIFGEFEYPFWERTSLTVGARFSRDDYRLVNAAGAVFDGSSDALTPKIGVRQQRSENLLWYATAARGYRPGGFDTFFQDEDATDEVTAAYDPEFAWNYEIGVNARLFDGLLETRAALFYLDWTDIQSVFFLDNSGLNTLIANAGAARSYGAELELTAYPTDHLTLNVNLGLLNAKYTDFDNTPAGDLTGNDLPFAPDVSLSVTGEYRRPISGLIDGFVRAEYAYRSDQEGRNDNNPTESQPGYDLLNLRLGLVMDRYELTVYGENVLDERYFTNRRGGLPGTPNSVVPGAPRTWGIRGTIRF
ncbi:MAG: TonB-dependent receptor [Pseudomonadota bacterium]